MLDTLQGFILLAMSVALFVCAAWGLIDALRYPDSSYKAAGKQSRTLWCVLLSVATLLSFLFLGGGILNLLGIAAVIVVLLYFVDVRPKLQQHGRGPATPRQQSGGW